MLNEERKGYKKTKIGWIPNDWTIISLEKVASKIGSGVTPKGGSKVYLDKGIPLVRSQNVLVGKLLIDDAVCITQEQHDKMASTKLKGDDVLLNITGASIGRSCVVPVFIKEGNVNQHVCIIRLDDTYNASLLSTYLNSYIGQKLIASFQSGGNREGLNFQQIKSFPIPYPTIEEQNKIAQILSTWDKAITTLEQLIAKKQELKKGLMQVLLTGKVRHKGFKEKWKKRRLYEVADFRNGKGHEKSIDEKGRYVVVNSKFISTSGAIRKYSNSYLSPLNLEDIVMVMSDVPNGKAIAKCYLIEADGLYTLNQRICALKAKNCDARFLFYLLNRNKYFLKFDNGVGQTNLRKNQILSCPFLMPNLEEQKLIATILSNADEEKKSLEVFLGSIKHQKKGLLQRLLTGAIRIKI